MNDRGRGNSTSLDGARQAAERATLRILVTGATGCIGQAVVAAALRDGWAVRGMARSSPPVWWPGDAEYSRGSVSDREMVLRAAVGCSAIVHLAAPVHDWTQAKSRTLTQATIDGAANAAEAAREQNARLALVSTVGVYGTPSPSPVDERTATAPTTDYASAKLAAEERCQLVLPDTLVVRCAVVYGPGDRGNVWRLLCAIKRRRALVVGGGTNRKSIIYSENLADRILTAIATQTSGVWCAADQPALTQFELTKKIAQALGRPTPRSVPIGLTLAVARVADRIESLRVSGSSRWTTMVHSLTAETVVDGTRFDRKIGYAQAISIDEGLRRTIAAWQRGAQ